MREVEKRVRETYFNEDGLTLNRSRLSDIVCMYRKVEDKVLLDLEIYRCNACDGLNTNSTKSAPGYGNLSSPVFILGQSLCTACMKTQVPFTRGSGDFLDVAIDAAGYKKRDLFITNVVHCHPPKNRKSSTDEKRNCQEYLVRELDLVSPKMVIALGTDAKKSNALHYWTDNYRKAKDCVVVHCHHPAYFMYVGNKDLLYWVIKVSELIRKGMRNV